ncbi:transmembrane protein 138 isoform X2 [Phymastichus coffea]|uniref:transmembrane protein 138 isoform X2 n=1 Tax=Phymastichus coffea TaxID=108790 RepID=UPI00273AEF68|nr:transmembrane protein 138 isoform X2 [Phymastichus coffea]
MSLLTSNKYSFTLILQYLCLLLDISTNSFATFAKNRPADLLVLFVVQDFCLIIALTILLANLFSTYIFQAGLIQLLYAQFRMTLVICVIYIILSIGLHSWHMTIYWTSPLDHFWSVGYHSLYSIHRTTAVLYYYFSKRASLRISDPRFHEGSKWMQKHFNLS